MANEKSPTPEERAARAFRRIDPETYGLPGGAVTDRDRVRRAFTQALESGCNLLAPETEIDFIPPGYAISLRVVVFDASFTDHQLRVQKSNGMWYVTDGGKLALHYTSLNLLAQAAGLDWIESTRVDHGEEPLVWRFRAAARVRLFDGSIRTERANRELDLRNGKPEATAMTEKQLPKARQNGAQLCESKCKARVIRALLGLRASYTPEEAARPFVYPALVWIPPNDPVIQRMMAAKELGILGEVFGPGASARAIIDVPAEEPARPALPDHGEPTTPDFRAEAERLDGRERVARGDTGGDTGGDVDVDQFEPMPGAPGEGEPMPAPRCKTCGEEVSPELAAWGERNLGAVYCRTDGENVQRARRQAQRTGGRS